MGMNNSKHIRPVILNLEPTDEKLAKLILQERRIRQKDRRKLHTYIAEDRRSGIADRRKKSSDD
jgi:hypothetical protein